jgi:hypothetical protein
VTGYSNLKHIPSMNIIKFVQQGDVPCAAFPLPSTVHCTKVDIELRLTTCHAVV